MDVEREISDLKGRVETIEGILQKCETGQHWDLSTQTCVEDTPLPPISQGLTLMAAAGSKADGANTANCVIDGKTTTRFSSQGPNAWLCIDLGGIQEIHKIQFTWFNQANEKRRNTVGIDFYDEIWPMVPTAAPAVSHTNETEVSTVDFTSGFTTGAKKARAIMIRLIATSHTGNWFSVIDVKVSGVQLVTPIAPPAFQPEVSQQEPAPPAAGPGPQQPQTQALDGFGYQKIFPDIGLPINSWEFGGNANDSRFFESKIRFVSGQSGKNGWLTTDKLNQLRLGVLPVAGLKWQDIETYHWKKVVDKGGFLNKRRNSSDNRGDWGDIEVTWAIRNWVPGSGSYESHLEIVIGGFRQSHANYDKVGKDKAVELPCQAMSYHFNIYPPPGTNRVKMEKDIYHNKGYTVESSNPKKSSALGFINAKAGFVMKAIQYRVKDTKVYGGFAMKLELWLSTDGLSGKKFRKVLEYLDAGKWGPLKAISAKRCGCLDEYPVLPMDKCNPHFRFDFAKSAEFGRMSVRSINPAKALISSS